MAGTPRSRIAKKTFTTIHVTEIRGGEQYTKPTEETFTKRVDDPEHWASDKIDRYNNGAKADRVLLGVILEDTFDPDRISHDWYAHDYDDEGAVLFQCAGCGITGVAINDAGTLIEADEGYEHAAYTQCGTAERQQAIERINNQHDGLYKCS